MLHSIYHSILHQHWKNSGLAFPPQIIRLADTIVQMTLAVHQKIIHTFLPTAQKFHYVFNMKELTNLFQVGIHNFSKPLLLQRKNLVSSYLKLLEPQETV